MPRRRIQCVAFLISLATSPRPSKDWAPHWVLTGEEVKSIAKEYTRHRRIPRLYTLTTEEIEELREGLFAASFWEEPYPLSIEEL